MKISSPDFDTNSGIPSKYTCDGDNISPHLHIEAVPDGTKSLVLVVEDPDAPTGTFTHWIMWDIDPDVDNIQENGVPPGAIQGLNSSGSIGYTGPCPPSGTHRYYFRLYALSRPVSLTFDTDKTEVIQAMEGCTLEHTEFMSSYTRPQI